MAVKEQGKSDAHPIYGTEGKKLK